jgi:prevent-host-death family protein
MLPGGAIAEKVGIRQLKNQASRVIHRVSDEMVGYMVTLRGEPVALLRPLSKEQAERLRRAEVGESLAEMKALARRVAEAWVSEESGLSLLMQPGEGLHWEVVVRRQVQASVRQVTGQVRPS